MSYKIGEVSKILDIPIETLRYYEKHNIVDPAKDAQNRYRFYEPWDINFLTECKRLRSLDFSLADIHSILHCDDLAQFSQRFENKQAEYAYQMKHYQFLMEKNERLQRELADLSSNLGQIYISDRPDTYYLMHRRNYTYNKKEDFNGILEMWLQFLSFTEIMIEMKEEDVLNREDVNTHFWGFSLDKKYVEAFGIPLNDKIMYEQSTPCVTTIICAGGEGSFSLRLLDNAMEYIDKQGLKLAGNVMGHLLARVHEREGFHRYIKVWLPVV